MRVLSVVLLTAVCACSVGTPLHAQDPPPPIGPFVLDVRGSVPNFSREEPLAASRGLQQLELPGAGLGLDAGVHLYLARWKAITFGIGAQATLGRARSEARVAGELQLRAVTQTLRSFTPQLSFNFGSGHGWSYISGGIGQSIWAVSADGADLLASDRARLRTFNYGGGARWFMKRHLAFHVDARFHEIHPGLAESALPPPPRTTMLVIGAGISLKR